MRQDWTLVQAVLDYRNAGVAVELFNQGRKGVEQIQREPLLAEILLELHRAQDGAVTMAGVVADMQTRGDEEP